MSGDDKSSWSSNEPATYTAYDHEGKLIGTYNTQLQADQAKQEHFDNLRRQGQTPPSPPPNQQPGIEAAPRVAIPDTFKKIIRFLGCAVVLIVGIFVALWIFGWVIATFVVK